MSAGKGAVISKGIRKWVINGEIGPRQGLETGARKLMALSI